MSQTIMYKIIFYSPESHIETIKNALFSAGAGKIGHYSQCAWQVLGEGQFMPLAGNNAYTGKVGALTKVAEYKIEMVCDDNYIHDAIQALKKSHPYEEPAYFVLRMETI